MEKLYFLNNKTKKKPSDGSLLVYSVMIVVPSTYNTASYDPLLQVEDLSVKIEYPNDSLTIENYLHIIEVNVLKMLDIKPDILGLQSRTSALTIMF